MAVNFFEKQKKKQRNMIIVFFVVLVITAIVLWYGFFKPEPTFEVSPESVAPPREININFTFLESPDLKELEPFSEIAPYAGTVGRDNPFLPY